ncbi:MAG TPA: penicillin acylase family protein [Usitatibacter sp.]|nr:penicillin acylase family protein [Usitatibacter sp.]
MILLLALVAAGAWGWLARSLPQLDGTAPAPGLSAAARIVRDVEGVPHIFAASERDGWFAMGYAHAQDRLWQMEFQRRVAQGRLSELLGERAYDVDRLMRTLGIARVSERIVANLDAGTRANLEAYAAGVNAFLAAKPVLPVGFQVFGIEPAPWKPADSIGWLLVMAWDLSGNWRLELARLRFSAKLGPQRTAELLPPYPGDKYPPLPDLHALYAEVAPQANALLAAYPPPGESIGSNNWVVSGARSETGKPLLANDPHLGLQAPSLWYLAHVSTPQGNVVGGTLPGIPFVVLGRNDRLAWSMTTTNSDTQDLFVERVVPGDPSRYVTPTGTARFEVRDEVIRVGNEERHIRVRSTRHGPVISDAVKAAHDAAPSGGVIALSWAGLTEENATARAGFRMNRARNEAEFIDALRDFTAPHQNVVFADRDGHIGLIAAARVPVRRPDNEAMGRVPVPGWDARYDWQGFLPFEQMPRVLDPPEGEIVTANDKITPPGYRPFLGFDWFPPYRSDRIRERLAMKAKHSIDSFASIQADTVSRLARELLPFALAARPATEAGKKARSLLEGWNADMRADERAPLAFAGWYRELTRLVYSDELGELFHDSWDMRATFMIAVMKNENGEGRWCDDVTTPARESCAGMAARAFDRAAEDLGKRYGGIERWGEAHYATGDQRPFGFMPIVKRLFNIEPRTPGDTYSIDVGHYFMRDEERPFANRHAPSLRAIYDLADLDRSLYIQSTGESGNFLSPWYASFAERWAKVRYIPIPTRREAIRAAHTLTLEPR